MKIQTIINICLASVIVASTTACSSTADSQNTETATAEIKSVTIGDQIWMSENLNVSKFSNGDDIPQAVSTADWKVAAENQTPAWCYYDNDEAKGKQYGKLYNWYAVNDARGLLPKGWHVPTDTDMDAFKAAAGEFSIAANNLKSKEGWAAEESVVNTNETGFNGLAGGCRMEHAAFLYETKNASFWNDSEAGENKAYYFGLNHYNGIIQKGSADKGTGYYVRGIKD